MSTFLNFFPREKYIRKLVEALITQDDYSEYGDDDGDDGDDSGGVGDDDDYQGKLIEAGYAEKPGWRVKSIATSKGTEFHSTGCLKKLPYVKIGRGDISADNEKSIIFIDKCR